MFYEDHSTDKLGVAYYGSKSPAEWAEIFGRRTLNAMIANAPIQDVAYWARLAGSYAEVVLEQREQVREMARDILTGSGYGVNQ